MLSTTHAIALATAAHSRLIERLSGLTDNQTRQPSRLPDWTVGHVLTHIARNAEGHTRRLDGALRGENVARYPGGSASRDQDIETGSGRPAAELVADIAATNATLERVWQRCEAAGWPNAHLMGADQWEITESPARRLREVEIHHVDLGLGYGADSWSDDYAAWELQKSLARLPERLDGAQTRQMVLWLTGRIETPDIELGPWG